MLNLHFKKIRPFYLDFEVLVLPEFRLSFYLGVQLLIELSEQSEYFTICLYCVKVVQVGKVKFNINHITYQIIESLKKALNGWY
jgi:hypothetical protein